jgi:hypothetical protein
MRVHLNWNNNRSKHFWLIFVKYFTLGWLNIWFPSDKKIVVLLMHYYSFLAQYHNKCLDINWSRLLRSAILSLWYSHFEVTWLLRDHFNSKTCVRFVLTNNSILTDPAYFVPPSCHCGILTLRSCDFWEITLREKHVRDFWEITLTAKHVFGLFTWKTWKCWMRVHLSWNNHRRK